MRERNGLRAFLAQVDSRRVRANLRILPSSPQRVASSPSSLRRRLDRESLGDTPFKTEMIAPDAITRHRSEVDAYLLVSHVHSQVSCDPISPPQVNKKMRVPFQRALVMLPDPFFAVWRKIFSQSFMQYPEQTNKKKFAFTHAQQQVSRRIFSDLATAISVLSPLQMPIVDGRIPGPFGDRPIPSFPRETALLFSYESVVASLSQPKNESMYDHNVSSSLPHLHLQTHGYARLLRFIARDVDIDWESRFTFSPRKNTSSLSAQRTPCLSDGEVAERGKCALSMLVNGASSVAHRLRAVSSDVEKMRSFYQSNPASLCVVHRLLSDKFPLVHEQLILLYDFVELSSYCGSN